MLMFSPDWYPNYNVTYEIIKKLKPTCIGYGWKKWNLITKHGMSDEAEDDYVLAYYAHQLLE